MLDGRVSLVGVRACRRYIPTSRLLWWASPLTLGASNDRTRSGPWPSVPPGRPPRTCRCGAGRIPLSCSTCRASPPEGRSSCEGDSRRAALFRGNTEPNRSMSATCSRPLIAEDVRGWGAVLPVRYPDRETFGRMVADPEYQKIADLRSAASSETVLWPTRPRGSRLDSRTCPWATARPETFRRTSTRVRSPSKVLRSRSGRSSAAVVEIPSEPQGVGRTLTARKCPKIFGNLVDPGRCEGTGSQGYLRLKS